MFRSFVQYFRSPEDNDPSFIQLTRNILIFTLVGNLLALLAVSGLIIKSAQNNFAAATLGVTAILEAIALFLAHRNKVRMGKVIVPLSLTLAITLIAISTHGLHSTALLGFGFVVVIGTLLLGRAANYTVTPLTIIAVELVALSDLTGFTPSEMVKETDLSDAFIVGLLVYISSAVLQLLMKRLNQNVLKAQENERLQIEANRSLKELQTSLEIRIEERTTELSAVNQRNQRRVQQFEAISQVARAITSIQNIELLLPRITELIGQYFGFYHAGIFLIDENREYAILTAANSEGGRKMLARGHKLPLGQTGIVGYVTGSGYPRIALDTGTDAVFFDNPDLPQTRSEIALPLRISGQIIGALDVQSIEQNAFTQDDIQILSTLADQVSVAIQNARSFEETRKLLKEAQAAASSYITEPWKVLRPGQKAPGYRASANSVKPLENPLTGSHIETAIKKGEIIASDQNPSNLAVPIRLRGRVIGVIDLRNSTRLPWNQDQIDIATAVAERVSLALETATLLQATQRRADIERVTSDISDRISSSVRFDTILETAAEELSRALGGSEVLVQIEPVAMELGTIE